MGKPTVRGLVEGSGKTPLREFKGTYVDTREEVRYGDDNWILMFKDLDVVKATEPYPFGTAELPFKQTNRKNSGWGKFAESLAAIMPDNEDIDDQKDKTFHMVMEEGYLYGKDRDGKEMKGDIWRVVAINGATGAASGGATNAEAEAMALLNGKTSVEFNQAAYGNAVIKSDAAFLSKVVSGAFIADMVASGKFTVDANGIYSKV
jgi:hypothetical protein